MPEERDDFPPDSLLVGEDSTRIELRVLAIIGALKLCHEKWKFLSQRFSLVLNILVSYSSEFLEMCMD